MNHEELGRLPVSRAEGNGSSELVDDNTDESKKLNSRSIKAVWEDLVDRGNPFGRI